MRLMIALVALVLVGCGSAPVSPAPSPSAPSAPAAVPSASRDPYSAACLSAKDDIAAISDLVGAMLSAMTQGNPAGGTTYRDDARAAATTAVKRLPEGYGTVTPLFYYAQRLRDLLETMGPQPDATEVRNATVKLVSAGGALASCSGS